ncbi:nuclear transport factor 2 family protein [Rhodobacteraceae bacterium 63075]|nr:nuclear transport factor 2 family protein [Rhodobacteraceae bacterium 63075]
MQKQDIPLFQQEKNLVREYYAALDATLPEALEQVAERFVEADAPWRGFHPFGELTGPAEVAESFWRPLRRALTNMQRREDIFFAGRNEIDGFESVWVVSMGHLVGLFDQPWLGIAPTGKMAFLRYAEFNRVEGGRIVDTAMYFDIPHLMAQAGVGPFPVQTAAHLVQPGPITHDGLLLEDQPEEEGRATLAAINAMISDLGQWQSGLPLEDELARSWHDDMIWWGPEGIGATCTIARYARQHAGPFRAAFSDRSSSGHTCRLAEGHYGGFFGWPSFTARLTGPFMGREPTGRMGEFRVIDIYRREGDKLAENWVFIDLLHFWKMQGVDFLGQMQKRAAS